MNVEQVSGSSIPMSPPMQGLGKPPSGFSDLLRNALAEANHNQSQVENLIERMTTGEQINPAVLASAVNKSDLAFRTLIQIRNKLTSAFDELRQLQV